MDGHDGINFLTWHREYLAKFEASLMAVNPLVTIPYWDWVNDPEIPEPLNDLRVPRVEVGRSSRSRLRSQPHARCGDDQ